MKELWQSKTERQGPTQHLGTIQCFPIHMRLLFSVTVEKSATIFWPIAYSAEIASLNKNEPHVDDLQTREYSKRDCWWDPAIRQEFSTSEGTEFSEDFSAEKLPLVFWPTVQTIRDSSN